MRSTERLICLLESVNGEALNNDVAAGRGIGDHIAELCREAAQRLRELYLLEQPKDFVVTNRKLDDHVFEINEPATTAYDDVFVEVPRTDIVVGGGKVYRADYSPIEELSDDHEGDRGC